MANAEQERQSANAAFKFGSLFIWANKLRATWLLGDALFFLYFAIFNESKNKKTL